MSHIMSDSTKPSASAVMSRRNMNCSELLSHVQRMEASLPASSASFFGHPPPPTMHASNLASTIHGDDEEVFLLVAQTRRCVCAQLWILPKDSDETPHFNEVMDVLRLTEGDQLHCSVEEQGEAITCATILNLDGSLQGDKAGTVPLLSSVSIVVGTSSSRVLSVEFVMEEWTTGQRTLRRYDDTIPFFEPIPLDSQSPIQAGEQPGSTAIDNEQSFLELSAAREASGNEGTKEEESVAAASQDEPEKGASVSHKKHPFSPQGGVTSLNPFLSKNQRDESVTLVWIAYQDGNTVRLHHGGFFPSIVLQPSFDLGPDAIVMSRVMLPPSLEAAGATVLPLPKYHPSPLSPLPPSKEWNSPDDDDDDDGAESTPVSTENASEDEEENDSVMTEIHEALSYGADSGVAGIGQDDVPALSFYTSENHFELHATNDSKARTALAGADKEMLDTIKGNVIGGTKALVRGVFGTAMGAVKWGLTGGGGGDKNEERLDEGGSGNDEMDAVDSVLQPSSIAAPFSSIYCEPTNLFIGHEMHDAPRQITSVSIDPDGNVAAAADNLGRVLLIDLSTKQVVRMFKGVREASCYWIQVARLHVDKPWQKRPILYLVVHSKQKRAVEVWRMRHGPRVKSIQVGRDSQIVQYREASESGSLSRCFLVHSTSTGTAQSRMESLTIEDEKTTRAGVAATKHSSGFKGPSKATQESALRLQLLKQLLADTNVPSNSQAVFEALTKITSLNDLCSALEMLAVSPQLEESMGVDGTSFQTLAVNFCEKKAEAIVNDGGDGVFDNPHVREFTLKIQYHKQVVDAYNVLHKFETKKSDDEDEDVNVVPRSAWAVEALAWIDTYEKVTGSSIDAETTLQTREHLRFASFSKACGASEADSVVGKGVDAQRQHIRFTDSTRTRTEALVHVFRPLLDDVFSFQVVNSIFENLGIDRDYDYLLKCFGEWFMTLPARQAAQKSFFIWNSPMVRWLQGVVTSQLDPKVIPDTPLESVHSFCSESPNLVRAFLLATLCREAVAVAARQKEEKTYGKISCSAAVRPWDSLLRKLRVCVFISLRLHGFRLGAFPISIDNVNADDIFSVYEWLARDELFMSHKQEEITMLETACKESGLVFHPSLEEGDDPLRVKLLQKACVVSVRKQGLRVGFSDSAGHDDQPGALLLYLSSHNCPPLLVAHRALLLCGKWGEEPSTLDILQDAVSALQALSAEGNDRTIATAVAIELWQTRIRPVYRAFLFGFADVPELSEDIVAPLYRDSDWLCGLGQAALEILNILSSVGWNGDQTADALDTTDETKKEESKTDLAWPSVKEDFILKRLVEKAPPVDLLGLDLHRTVVCASLLSEDLSSFSLCIPGFYDTFLQSSLFTQPSTVSTNTAQQREFVERVIVIRATRTTGGLGLIGPVLDSLELTEIDTIATIWGISTEDVRTTFMLAMYELGKDLMVDDLVASNAQSIDIDRFVQGGIDTSCRRLNEALNRLRNNSGKRHVIGMLDADTCQWVRERATDSHSFLEQYGENDKVDEVSLSLTHTFILRLLSLSLSAGAKATRLKIHSLSVLSGTLLKEQVAK